MLDPNWVRLEVLRALVSEQELVDHLVFKGGNALELIHQVGGRTSLDLDFSIENDFGDPDAAGTLLQKALTTRFEANDVVLFDYQFGPRPSTRRVGDPWGGYVATFKLIRCDVARNLGEDLDSMRRQAAVVGASQKRSFRIEISAFEWVAGKERADVGVGTLFVYSLEMIAVEKLRAICQQAPAYALRRNPAPRPRDFYDITKICEATGLEFDQPPTQDLVIAVFSQKEVDLSLLEGLDDQREFHRRGWSSVEVAVGSNLRDFDYYFDFVLEIVRPLHALWVE